MTEDKRREEIESALKRYMPADAGPANKVREAMEYALMAGGKRIRPQLLMLTYDAFMQRVDSTQDTLIPPIPREIALIFASALEMIHTYSLIHDDLPALDDDSLRRGRPTVHVAFGEDIAILAGDGLLNLAFEVAAEAMEIFPCERRIEQAMRILARRPGLFGMLGGQTADVTLAGTKLDDVKLEYIYANKTAALLECAMEMGAVLGGAATQEVEAVRKAAYHAGLAFQVQDDILDEIGDEASLGKEVGQDARNEKTTYVTLYGMDAARSYVQEMTDTSEKLLRELFPEDEGKAIGTAAEELIALLQGLVGRQK